MHGNLFRQTGSSLFTIPTPKVVAGRGRGFTGVCLSVCLSVFPHNVSKIDAASITKLQTEIFHHESWKPVYFGVKRSTVKLSRLTKKHRRFSIISIHRRHFRRKRGRLTADILSGYTRISIVKSPNIEPLIGVRSIATSVSVCLSVCLSARIFFLSFVDTGVQNNTRVDRACRRVVNTDSAYSDPVSRIAVALSALTSRSSTGGPTQARL